MDIICSLPFEFNIHHILDKSLKTYFFGYFFQILFPISEKSAFKEEIEFFFKVNFRDDSDLNATDVSHIG